MPDGTSLRVFCLINPGAGDRNIDYQKELKKFFKASPHQAHYFILQAGCTAEQVKESIATSRPDRVLAVGGDGTIKLAAESVLHSKIPLAIIPAGSANGMAREFNLPNDTLAALNIALNGKPRAIHATRVNNELCIHLADVGINAHIVKKFQEAKQRGLKGYAIAAWRVFLKKKRITLNIFIAGMHFKRKVEMLVIANGTTYGTGVRVNRSGSLFDDRIELVLVKSVSILELLKMRFSKNIAFDPFKTETIKTRRAEIFCGKKSYFQVDGEYRGKVSKIKAEIIENALQVVCP